MQSEEDAGRLLALGMNEDKLYTAGNLKFDAEVAEGMTAKTTELRERFGLQSEMPLILAASTHAPEEEVLLESIRQLQPARLMIAPRHPERFNEVAALIQKSGLSWTRRTAAATADDANAIVILLDTIGELPATYSLADVVFVGGSIVDRGGHNVLEPAAAGAAVVTGAHTHNFHAIVDLMCEAKAIVQLPPVENSAAAPELTHVLKNLLANTAERHELGRRAKQLVTDNQGAADRTINFIAPLLTHTS
jgi:3-deoxy-D-manno-octulosonic-acid transferase